ncbi:MAG: YggS family pyridoxal phosphate-dependent enzyme [Candidatus Heimdallarchaeaceae archaeon]
MSGLSAETDVKSNYQDVIRRVDKCAVHSGRDLSDITIVGVTKRIEMARIQLALDEGLQHLGEIVSTELKAKIDQIRSYSPSSIIHIVGQLQSNKAKFAIEKCDLVQSVRTAKVLSLLNKYAEKKNKIYPIFIQVDFSEGEALKGLDKTQLFNFIQEAQKFTSIDIKGLMTIAPLEYEQSPQILRKFFARTYKIFQEEFVQRVNKEELSLSMGMSSDYEIAIEEGSNLIRIGTAIFGPRLPK